jgi:hypothetical protein
MDYHRKGVEDAKHGRMGMEAVPGVGGPIVTRGLVQLTHEPGSVNSHRMIRPLAVIMMGVGRAARR